MKKILMFLCVNALIGAFGTACQNEEPEDPTVEVTTAGGLIETPRWLADRVESVADRYAASLEGARIYPWVYSVEHDRRNYVFVVDFLASDWNSGHMYFTSSGEPVDPGSSAGLYDDLEKARRASRSLLWRQPAEE